MKLIRRKYISISKVISLSYSSTKNKLQQTCDMNLITLFYSDIHQTGLWGQFIEHPSQTLIAKPSVTKLLSTVLIWPSLVVLLKSNLDD
jgi:hypothetical protein